MSGTSGGSGSGPEAGGRRQARCIERLVSESCGRDRGIYCAGFFFATRALQGPGPKRDSTLRVLPRLSRLFVSDVCMFGEPVISSRAPLFCPTRAIPGIWHPSSVTTILACCKADVPLLASAPRIPVCEMADQFLTRSTQTEHAALRRDWERRFFEILGSTFSRDWGGRNS
jgi:hypothetical protein